MVHLHEVRGFALSDVGLLPGLPRLVWTLCVLVAVFQSTGCERLRTSAGGAGFCGVPLLSRG
ncbi:hypothetical protein [Nocardioides sp.]|uniref:hypothetical protein n=1 Tax=Nocardioides sp. TaxID=35761 RepID=UPI0031FE67EA